MFTFNGNKNVLSLNNAYQITSYDIFITQSPEIATRNCRHEIGFCETIF